MTPDQIAKALSEKKGGNFFSVISRRPLKLKKGCFSTIEKESHMQGILAEYANTSNVKSGIQNGERDRPHLPKGVKECFYIGRIKFFRMESGKVCLAVNIAGNQPKSFFYKNGSLVEKEKLVDEVLSQDLAEKNTRAELAGVNQSPFVMIGVENIKSIG